MNEGAAGRTQASNSPGTDGSNANPGTGSPSAITGSGIVFGEVRRELTGNPDSSGVSGGSSASSPYPPVPSLTLLIGTTLPASCSTSVGGSSASRAPRSAGA